MISLQILWVCHPPPWARLTGKMTWGPSTKGLTAWTRETKPSGSPPGHLREVCPQDRSCFSRIFTDDASKIHPGKGQHQKAQRPSERQDWHPHSAPFCPQQTPSKQEEGAVGNRRQSSDRFFCGLVSSPMNDKRCLDEIPIPSPSKIMWFWGANKK